MVNLLKRKLCVLFVSCVIFTTAVLPASPVKAELNNANTDWISGNYGIGIHYLQDKFSDTKNGGSKEWNNAVNSFDTAKFANQAAATGAKWVLFTLGQNSGYYCSPNAVLDSYSGYKAGEKNSTRDLPMDLAKALNAKGIKLMLYLPSNAPANDSKIANAMGLTQMDWKDPNDHTKGGDWHVNEAFVQKWAKVIQEWSDRYGSKVSGWWFDGYFSGRGFRSGWGKYYSDAAKHGNSKSIIALNPGASSFTKPSDYEDYLAGERGTSTVLDTICTGRWFNGVQWHTFTPVGSWFSSTVKFTDQQYINYGNNTFKNGGAITWALYGNSKGTIGSAQVDLFNRIKSKLVTNGASSKQGEDGTF